MKIVKRVIPVAALALVLIAIGTMTSILRADANNTDATIPDKVYIGEIAVGGMTADEASVAVADYVSGQVDAEFTLSVGDKSIEASADELGIEWANTHVVEDALNIGKTGNLIDRYKAKKDLQNEDKVFEIEYTVNDEMVTSLLEENADKLNQKVVNNGLTKDGDSFTIIKGQSGIEIDVAESVDNMKEFFENEWDGSDAQIELAAETVEPQGTEEELAKIQDCLGTFHTDFSSSSAGRAANVKNATGLINGTVVYPGEEFSVYDTISPMDAENGYELAGSYENGTTVETYGGGVCQVSTTLYNAVIRAELEVTERYNHSMIVAYVDPSADAAIAGTSKNFKFKNNLDTPIYIDGYTNGGILYFSIYGEETRPANREVSFVSETTSQEDPVTQYVATGDPIGTITRTQSSHVGKNAVLWKVVTVDGVEESRTEFNTSRYKASPAIYSVGTGSANADAVAAINGAIATQDQATIEQTAAAWTDAAIAARAAQAQAEADAAAAEDKDKTEDSDKKDDSSDKSDASEDTTDKTSDDDSSANEGAEE